MSDYQRLKDEFQTGPNFGAPGSGFGVPASAGQTDMPELNSMLLTQGQKDSNGYYKGTLVNWSQSPINTTDLTQDPAKGIVTPIRFYTDYPLVEGVNRFVFGTVVGMTYNAPTPSDNGLQLYACILGGDNGVQLAVVQDVTTADLVSNKLVQGQLVTPSNDPTYSGRWGVSGDPIYITNMCWDLVKPVKPFVGQRFWVKKIGTYTPSGEGGLPTRDLYAMQGEVQYGYLAAFAEPASPISYPMAERGFDSVDPQRSYLIKEKTTGGKLRMQVQEAGVYSIELSGYYQLQDVPAAASPILFPISDWDPATFGITDTNVVAALNDLRTYYLTEIQAQAAMGVLKAVTGYLEIYKNGTRLIGNAAGPFLYRWVQSDGYWRPHLYREGSAVVWQGVLAAGDEIGWGGGMDTTGFTASVYEVKMELAYLGPDLSSLFV